MVEFQLHALWLRARAVADCRVMKPYECAYVDAESQWWAQRHPLPLFLFLGSGLVMFFQLQRPKESQVEIKWCPYVFVSTKNRRDPATWWHQSPGSWRQGM